MEKKKRNYIPRLTWKFFLWSTLFTALLCLVLGLISFISYEDDMYDRYLEYGDTLLEVNMAELDGDDIKESIARGEMSDTLLNGLEKMNVTKEHSEASYMYIVYFPEKDVEKMNYVLYANTAEDRELGSADSEINRSCGSDFTDKCKKAFYEAQYGNTAAKEGQYVINMYQGSIGENTLAMTVYRTIEDSSGNPVCVFGVDIFMDLIRVHLREYILHIFLGGIFLLAVCLLGFMIIMRKEVIRPVLKLEDSAKDFIRQTKQEEDPQKLSFQPVAVSADTEIRDLSKELENMTNQLKDYMVNLKIITIEKERIGTELSVATHIQADMLPSIFPPFPDRKEMDLYASMSPAKEVGGDFYDFFMVDQSRLALVIADVSGKGVPAALFMVISKTLLKNAAQQSLSPKEVLETVNKQLCENNQEGMFVTVWLGILDLNTGKMACANAGHEFPAIRRAGGQFELFKDKHGLVLGAMDMARYREYELAIEPGDSIFVYTDGVAEATNLDNQLFGTERMLDALNRVEGAECEELLRNVRKEVDEFVGEAPQFDDITMLTLKYHGKGQS